MSTLTRFELLYDGWSTTALLHRISSSHFFPLTSLAYDHEQREIEDSIEESEDFGGSQ